MGFVFLKDLFDYRVEIDRNALVCIPAHSCGSIS